MKKKQRDDDSGPQHVSPGERETKNRTDEQDFDKPEEGRDVPPEEAGKPKRDPNSPWLGGG